MNNKGITYTVQQVSEMIGISKQLVRKWEDRYKIITPSRLDNGYRMYTKNDVSILLEMKRLINSGHSPKQASDIIKNPPSNQAQITRSGISPNIQTPFHDEYNSIIERLVQCGADGDDAGIVAILQQAQLVMGVEQLLDEVITPFLLQVGDFWCDAVWGEFQEAMSSLAVRDFLVNLRRTIHVAPDAPLILGACLPGEHHEIPMHIILIKCMLRGYRTLMLGQSPAPTAIQSIIQLKNPGIVLLSASTMKPFEERLSDILELDEFAGNNLNTHFYLGGAAAFETRVPLRNLIKTNDLTIILQNQTAN